MAQSFFGSVSLNAASAANIYVKLGFIPGRIELIDLTQVQSPTNTNGWKSVWQQGMSQGTSLNTLYTTTADHTVYNSTNGITLLNSPGTENAQYGAAISAISNAGSGVVTVDSTLITPITAGCVVRIANVANDFTGPTLNGNYYVASVTATTVTLGTAPAGFSTQFTLTSPNTTSSGVYISGGFMTVLQTAQATTPNPPFNVYSNVPTFFNEAIQGFIIGTAVFPNATYSLTTPDLILVSAWDIMQP